MKNFCKVSHKNKTKFKHLGIAKKLINETKFESYKDIIVRKN